MKKYMLAMFVGCLSTMGQAQEEVSKTKVREVGLTTTSLVNNFGLTYRVGNEKMVWRFNTLFVNGFENDESRDDEDYKISNSNLGFNGGIGLEFRKPLAEKIAFRYGADVFYGYTQEKASEEWMNETGLGTKRYETRTTTANRNYFGFNLVMGINYLVAENIVLGAEILPYVSYVSGNRKRVDTQSTTNTPSVENVVSADISQRHSGISNGSVLLSAVLRF